MIESGRVGRDGVEQQSASMGAAQRRTIHRSTARYAAREESGRNPAAATAIHGRFGEEPDYASELEWAQPSKGLRGDFLTQKRVTLPLTVLLHSPAS